MEGDQAIGQSAIVVVGGPQTLLGLDRREDFSLLQDEIPELGVVGVFEQRSSLYGLLMMRKDKVGWEAAPVAQFN